RWRLIRFLVTPHRPSLVMATPRSHSKRACLLNVLRSDADSLRGTATSIADAAKLQASSPAGQPAPLNIFPFALNVYPGCFLHFLNSLGLFFSCSNADATTSALGMSGSVAPEKHVDLPWCEITRTNL